jgi:hypothetical protein
MYLVAGLLPPPQCQYSHATGDLRGEKIKLKILHLKFRKRIDGSKQTSLKHFVDLKVLLHSLKKTRINPATKSKNDLNNIDPY